MEYLFVVDTLVFSNIPQKRLLDFQYQVDLA